MSDQEFEKQVQQRMSDFKVSPGAAVWEHVARAINRNKRRRRAFIWLAAGIVLLLGGSGYFLYTGTTGNKSLTMQQQQANTTVPAASRNAAVTDGTRHQDATPGKATVQQPLENTTGEPALHQPTTAHIQPKNNSTGADPESITRPQATIAPRRNASTGKNTYTPATRWVNDKNNSAVIQTGKGNKKSKNLMDRHLQLKNNNKQGTVQENTIATDQPAADTDDELVATTVAHVPPVTVNSPAAVIPASAATIASNTNEVKVPENRAVASPWQWGFEGSSGIAGLAKGNSVFKTSPVQNMAAPNNAIATSPNTPYQGSSTVENGFSFSIGGFVQRNISRRVKVGSGLEFQYYTTHTRVGQYVNGYQSVNTGTNRATLVDQFYRGNGEMTYNNHYMFIGIPLNLQWQLNNHPKMPVVWENGIQLTQMIYTDALHYDGGSGVYYKDNSLFNKMQWSFSTGFSLGLLQRSRHPLFIGPEARYHLSSLLKGKNSDDVHRHIWFAGFTVKWIMKK